MGTASLRRVGRGHYPRVRAAELARAQRASGGWSNVDPEPSPTPGSARVERHLLCVALHRCACISYDRTARVAPYDDACCVWHQCALLDGSFAHSRVSLVCVLLLAPRASRLEITTGARP